VNIDFLQKDIKHWDQSLVAVQVQTLKSIKYAKSHNREFRVKFEGIEQEKTNPQLRGIHRLFSVIAKDFSKEAGQIVPPSQVKIMIKDEYGYFDDVNTKGGYYRSYKSLEKATKQELADMIEITQVMGIKWEIENCVLTSSETRAMINYYENKN
jgi:hypothetical protein